jgi:ATP-dependent protease ClpP protease subunit
MPDDYNTSTTELENSMTIFTIMGELTDKTSHELIKLFFGHPVDSSVHVVVDSEGGNSDVYCLFVDCTRRHRRAGTLCTVAAGEVMSGAPVIVAAGSPGLRYSYEHTSWGMHEPFVTEVCPDPVVQTAQMCSLQSCVDRFYNIISVLTDTSVRTWRGRLKGQSLLTFDAKQALKWNLIDEILE